MKTFIFIIAGILGCVLYALIIMNYLLTEKPDNSQLGKWIERNKKHKRIVAKWVLIALIIEIILLAIIKLNYK